MGRILTAAILLVSLWSSVTGAIAIDNFTSSTNDRFANSGSFLLNSWNLSAIAKNQSGWGTLISDNVIISANHLHPAVGSVLNFYKDNDPTGTPFEREIVSGQRIAASDIWLGVLSDPLPPDVQPLPFMTDTISSELRFRTVGLEDETGYMVGRSPSSFATDLDMAVGENILEYWWGPFDTAGTNDMAIVAIQQLSTDSGYLFNESKLNIGDSGGPLLAVVDGDLKVVGINWFNGYVTQGSTTRDLSGFSYVGNYASELNTVISDNASNVPGGFWTWAESLFGSSITSPLAAPARDFDGDDLSNFVEYAFCLDAVSAANPFVMQIGQNQVGDDLFLQASLLLREDSDLQFTIYLGSDLSSMSAISMVFTGNSWSSAQPTKLTVTASTEVTDGVWSVTVQDASAVLPGQTRFFRAGVE
ncbi:MAG: hypothetical protein AB3N63_01105 [Puniceicoccaceae bacterium]